MLSSSQSSQALREDRADDKINNFQIKARFDMQPTVLNISQNYYIRGGSDRYFFVLADLLAKHGHRVIPFSSRQQNNEPSEWQPFFPDGVNFGAPGIRDLARFIYSRPAARSLDRLLDQASVDLAHLHIYYGQLTASILPVLREAGIPIIQTIHDFKLVCPVYSLLSHGSICEACQGHKFWKATLNRCNRGSIRRSLLSTVESYVSRALGNVQAIDRFISVSNFQRHKLIELGVPGDKITTIYNFADTAGIRPETTPGDYLLYFGRVEKLKGVFTLVEAARRAADVRLLIAGRGEAQAELESFIAQHHIRNVEMVGFRQGAELEQLVRGSIATILPSEGYDNCPMAILESYSFGKPLIGSRIGGIPELIVPEVDGLIYVPGDADSLAAHMQWMHHHRDQAVEMGLRGREKVEREFNSEVHYQRVRAVYRQALHEEEVPPAVPSPPALPTIELPVLNTEMASFS